jgi:hypothetical protein
VTLAAGDIEPRAAIDALEELQFGDSGSETVTFVSVTLPVFDTTIVNVAVAPVEIVCDFGLLVIEIAGLCGLDDGGDDGGEDGGVVVTVTGAVSVSETSGPPPCGLPVAVALLVKLDVTFASVQV